MKIFFTPLHPSRLVYSLLYRRACEEFLPQFLLSSRSSILLVNGFKCSSKPEGIACIGMVKVIANVREDSRQYECEALADPEG